VHVLEPDGEVRDLARAECAPVYRDGRLGERIVLGAVLSLQQSSKQQVEERTREYLRQKNAVQPVSQLSAGCTFKNPDPETSDGLTAAQVLDRLGCKGLERGDAHVSPLHANFIVNRGRARATDVLALIEELRARALEGAGVVLELEVKVWP
jgi:UDP-N-acetylmuramate dehydrogenase